MVLAFLGYDRKLLQTRLDIEVLNKLSLSLNAFIRKSCIQMINTYDGSTFN